MYTQENANKVLRAMITKQFFNGFDLVDGVEDIVQKENTAQIYLSNGQSYSITINLN